jgi:histone H3/H4
MVVEASVDAPAHFKLCSECKKPIGFGADYYRCSVSTCNRTRLALFFCSVPCWDAHVPAMRHRDAWAEPVRAPTREAFLKELEEEEERAQRASRETNVTDELESRRRIVEARAADEAPREVLIVVSKLKAYVKARSGMNTSDGVVDVLSQHLREVCDRAIARAGTAGRKTVMDRDFSAALEDDERR